MLRSIVIIAAILMAGCADSTGPGSSVSTPAPFVGSVDPGSGTFVLDRTEVTVPGGVPVPVELVGSNLESDPAHDLLWIDVALRNAGSQPLYPPALVWVSDFVPATVRVTNSNVPQFGPLLTRWGFDYGRMLGPDELLGPGEVSEALRWRFYDPGLESFSFAVEADLALEPPPAVISGGVFEDLNQNGIRERNEGPWPYGFLHLTHPDGKQEGAYCDESGSFRFLVAEPGLYRLELESLIDCIVCFTTPNPLEILLSPGPDGHPESFEMAVFGAICGPCDPAQ